MNDELLQLFMHAGKVGPLGSSWVTNNMPTGTWQAVAWSPTLNLFVAVGNGTTVAKSSDGHVWTTTTCPNSVWNDVCWASGLGKFVAVGTGSTNVMTSVDGTTWVSSGSISAINVTSVCWSQAKSLLVVTTQENSSSSTVTGYILTSPTGSSWTTRATQLPTAGNTERGYYSVCWSATLGVFAAVGKSTAMFISSPDGLTWTTGSLGASVVPFKVIWSDFSNKFIAFGTAAGGTYIATSTNGSSWTTVIGTPSQWGAAVDTPSGSFGFQHNQTATTTVAQSLNGSFWPFVAGVSAPVSSWKGCAYSPSLNRMVVIAFTSPYGMNSA